jgi:hypothetical protein
MQEICAEDQLLILNERSSLNAFMDYVNGPHNVLKLYRKSLQELGAQMLRDVIIACSTLIFEKL